MSSACLLIRWNLTCICSLFPMMICFSDLRLVFSSFLFPDLSWSLVIPLPAISNLRPPGQGCHFTFSSRVSYELNVPSLDVPVSLMLHPPTETFGPHGFYLSWIWLNVFDGIWPTPWFHLVRFLYCSSSSLPLLVFQDELCTISFRRLTFFIPNRLKCT